jgi:hypothetical protein
MGAQYIEQHARAETGEHQRDEDFETLAPGEMVGAQPGGRRWRDGDAWEFIRGNA